MGLFNKLFNRSSRRVNPLDVYKGNNTFYSKKTDKPISGIYEIPEDYKKKIGKLIIQLENGESRKVTRYFYMEQGEVMETYEMKDGKRHGITEVFNLFGPERTENYRNGELHGVVIQHRKDGESLISGNYDNGKLIPYESYYDNGQLKEKMSWKLGIGTTTPDKDGKWETFDEEGNVTKTEEYKNGKLIE